MNQSTKPIAILEKLPYLKSSKIISHFDGSNNIFDDCTIQKFLFTDQKALVCNYLRIKYFFGTLIKFVGMLIVPTEFIFFILVIG